MVFATEFDPTHQTQNPPAPGHVGQSPQGLSLQGQSLQGRSPQGHSPQAYRRQDSQGKRMEPRPAATPTRRVNIQHPAGALQNGIAASDRTRPRISASTHPQRNAPTSSRTDHPTGQVIPLQLKGPAVRVSKLPAKPKLPWGLQLLDRLQQGSTIITTILVTGALAMYGSTVYVDKASNRALAQLDHLQGESQQLTSANEAIKQSLAEQAAHPNSGLEPLEAGDVIFVSPEPRREANELTPPPAELPPPMGY